MNRKRSFFVNTLSVQRKWEKQYYTRSKSFHNPVIVLNNRFKIIILNTLWSPRSDLAHTVSLWLCHRAAHVRCGRAHARTLAECPQRKPEAWILAKVAMGTE